MCVCVQVCVCVTYILLWLIFTTVDPPSYDSILQFHLLWFLFCDSPSCGSYNGFFFLWPLPSQLCHLCTLYMLTGASTLTPLFWVYFDLQYNGSHCGALFCSYCESLNFFVVLILSFMSLHSVTPLETNPPVEPLTQLRIH